MERARATLPDDPATLPPLGPPFDSILDEALRSLDLSLDERARGAIEVHARLLLSWTGAINLSGHRTPEAVALHHVADSLVAVPLMREQAEQRGRPLSILDLGSGGGYPGIPLAVAVPAGHVALVESVAKKAVFLEVAAAAVDRRLRAGDAGAELTEGVRIESIPARAEALARDGGQREQWDAVVVRAVGSIAEIAELAAPLTAIGGRIVAWKRVLPRLALDEELAAANLLLHELGLGETPGIVPARIPGLADHGLVVLEKRRPTPPSFPREPAERRVAGTI